MGEPYEVGFDVTPGPDPAPGTLRRGGCLCGAVRYEARGDPVLVGLCHCGDCRRESGSLGLYWADWPPDAVRMTGTLYTYQGRSFCPTCGARVAHLGAHETGLMLGTLDGPPTGLVPTRELWTIRREPWLAPVPGAEQFERDA